MESFSGRSDVARAAIRLLIERDLAELHADDPILGQMAQTELDHLDGVQVALRQDVRAGAGCVHGGIAVGGYEEDDVVEAVAGREVRSAFAV
jgi:hypothetical protein